MKCIFKQANILVSSNLYWIIKYFNAGYESTLILDGYQNGWINIAGYESILILDGYQNGWIMVELIFKKK